VSNADGGVEFVKKTKLDLGRPRASGDRSVELYDLEADPAESENLAGRLTVKAAELSGALSRWRHRVGAQMPIPNPDFTPPRN
jgi:hypothetical protein